VDGGIELTMELRGTKEFVSWLLQWGDEAELLAPDTLRTELAEETAKMAARYRRAPAAVQTSLPIGDA
jgi:predicted DNA-binding transcriptional regulator YafY